MSKLAKSGAVMAAAIAIVSAWEGVKLTAYPDQFANGLPTVCFGETRGVKLGDKYTLDQCKKMLGEALIEFETGMRKCLKNPDEIPDKSYVAFLSLSYNIGTAAFCRSSLPAMINAGNVRGACEALVYFNRAGGKVIPGLVNRRAAERKLCLGGLH